MNPAPLSFELDWASHHSRHMAVQQKAPLCFIHTCPSSMFRRPSSVISHQSSASVTTIHTYQSFQSCGHRFLCTDSFKYVQSGKVVDRSIICGEFPIHSSLPWFMVRIRHPSSVKIAPGPILTDDGWRTTDDGLGVNGPSYFLSERFWLKRTTDDWSGRRMVWRTGVNGA